MSEEDERTRVNRLRFALGGATDAETREIERLVESGDPATCADVRGLQVTAAVIRSDAEGAPGADVMARLRNLARAEDVLPPEEEWLIATPITMPAGVRGPLQKADVLNLETEEFSLTVTLRNASGDDGLSPRGQLVGRDGEPLSGIEIALIVDRQIVTQAHSDEFGEFAFAAARGSEYMLRLLGSYGPHFIQLRRDDSAS